MGLLKVHVGSTIGICAQCERRSTRDPLKTNLHLGFPIVFGRHRSCVIALEFLSAPGTGVKYEIRIDALPITKIRCDKYTVGG